MIDEELIETLFLHNREIRKESVLTEEKQYAMREAAGMLVTEGKFYTVEYAQGRNHLMSERGEQLPEEHPDYIWIKEQAQNQILGEVNEIEVRLNGLR